MSIEREGPLTRFVCDERGCRKNYEVHDEMFAASWAEAKHAGWVNAERDGAWTHYCPECKRDLGDD
jgi:hypothetical protein